MVQILNDILSSRTLHIIVIFPIGAMALLQLRNIYMEFLARRRDAATREVSGDDMDEVEKMFGKTLMRFMEPYFIVMFVCHMSINFIFNNQVMISFFAGLLLLYTLPIGIAVIYKALRYFMLKKTTQ